MKLLSTLLPRNSMCSISSYILNFKVLSSHYMVYFNSYYMYCCTERTGKERTGKERRGEERKGKERKGEGREGKGRKGKERKGKERRGKGRNYFHISTIVITVYVILWLLLNLLLHWVLVPFLPSYSLVLGQSLSISIITTALLLPILITYYIRLTPNAQPLLPFLVTILVHNGVK